MITVLIADDQAMVRSGFAMILAAQPDLRVVAECADGVEAWAAVRRLRPAVALLDVRMPRLDGIEVTRLITGSSPQAEGLAGTAVVVVTTFDDDEHVYAALHAGAVGFLLKDAGPALLVEAVRAAAAGEALISPAVTVRLLARLAAAAPGRHTSGQDLLTSRERDVVRLVATGLTNEEVARALFVSLGTIKTHLSGVANKLGTRNRVEVAAWAWQHGLVAPQQDKDR